MINYNRRNILVGFNYVKANKERYDETEIRFKLEDDEEVIPQTPENTIYIGELKQEDEETVTNSLSLKINDIRDTIRKLKRGEIS